MAVIRDPEVNFPMITIPRLSTLAPFRNGVAAENLGGVGYYIEDAEEVLAQRP
jgi:hypothetical protein